MKTKVILLQEMESALSEANKCSEVVEQLLRQARENGGATPDLFKAITEANKHCNEAMERYITSYKAYYNVSPGNYSGTPD